MTQAFPTFVFADGASSGNPGPGGWGAIIATADGQVIELGGHDPQTTNNRMELVAVIRALDRLSKMPSFKAAPTPVQVLTDSVYVIRGITQWIWGWQRKGWKTAEGNDVSNVELWRALSAAVMQFKGLAKLEWGYVRGHSGIPGNERVDQIAVAFSKRNYVDLYQGTLLNYGVPIHDLPDSLELPESRPRENGPKPKAHSYLSVIGGVPMRHTSWAECERRVKGQPGAKFKKAMSAEEEVKILSSWGYSPSQLKSSG